MRLITITLLLILLLTLTSCTLPKQGICIDARNWTFVEDGLRQGSLKLAECPQEHTSLANNETVNLTVRILQDGVIDLTHGGEN